LATALLLPLAARSKTTAPVTWRVGPGEAINRIADAIRLGQR
jgi:hypothetical protein